MKQVVSLSSNTALDIYLIHNNVSNTALDISISIKRIVCLSVSVSVSMHSHSFLSQCIRTVFKIQS